MNRVLVVAPSMVYMKNWAEAQNLPANFLLYVDDPRKVMGFERGMRYVWIDNPARQGDADRLRGIFRAKGNIQLPIDVNDWPLNELPNLG